MSTETFVLKRIEMLEQELKRLRKAISRKTSARRVKLRGIWKGVDIPDEAIEAAKHSLFRDA